MDDKDHVFARFQDNKPASADRRETLTIPRRAGATGSRVVQVVHVKSSTPGKDRPRRTDAQLRAASWDGGFPMKPPALPQREPDPTVVEASEPTVHVMPAWEPSAPDIEAAGQVPPEDLAAPAPPKPRGRPGRRVADPFDAGDEGANCMRCGYAVESVREKRGLMTCAACA